MKSDLNAGQVFHETLSVCVCHVCVDVGGCGCVCGWVLEDLLVVVVHAVFMQH